MVPGSSPKNGPEVQSWEWAPSRAGRQVGYGAAQLATSARPLPTRQPLRRGATNPVRGERTATDRRRRASAAPTPYKFPLVAET